MQYEIIWSLDAGTDLLKIVSYIKEHSGTIIAQSIYDRIKARVTPLKDFPGTGRPVPEVVKIGVTDIQQISEKPLKIYYKVFEKTINIVSVIDSRRNLEEVLYEKVMEGKIK